MSTKYDEISISDPNTGHIEVFSTVREARAFAKKRKYTPVFINLFDETGIIDDIRVENPNQPTI